MSGFCNARQRKATRFGNGLNMGSKGEGRNKDKVKAVFLVNKVMSTEVKNNQDMRETCTRFSRHLIETEMAVEHSGTKDGQGFIWRQERELVTRWSNFSGRKGLKRVPWPHCMQNKAREGITLIPFIQTGYCSALSQYETLYEKKINDSVHTRSGLQSMETAARINVC